MSLQHFKIIYTKKNQTFEMNRIIDSLKYNSAIFKSLRKVNANFRMLISFQWQNKKISLNLKFASEEMSFIYCVVCMYLYVPLTVLFCFSIMVYLRYNFVFCHYIFRRVYILAYVWRYLEFHGSVNTHFGWWWWWNNLAK